MNVIVRILFRWEFRKMFNHDHKTTAAGGIGAIALLSTVDPAKLIVGDYTELGKVIFAISIGVLGYFTNKKDPKAEAAK
jgi:hypothetical protein